MTAQKRGSTQQAAKLNRQYKSRKQRPCDFCRKRKVCCIINGSLPCVRCEKLNGGNCTFNDGPIKKQRRNAPPKEYPAALTAPYIKQHDYEFSPLASSSLASSSSNLYQPEAQVNHCPPRPYIPIPPQMRTFVVGDRQPVDGCKPIGWPLQEFLGWFPLLPAEIRTPQSVTGGVLQNNDGNLEQRTHNQQGYSIGDVDGMGEDLHEYILKSDQKAAGSTPASG